MYDYLELQPIYALQNSFLYLIHAKSPPVKCRYVDQ